MTSPNITIDWNVAGMDSIIGRAIAVIQRTVPAWMENEAEAWLRGRMESRFAKEGDDAVGGPWKPLAPLTIRERTSNGFVPIRTNHRTGELERWLESGGQVVSGTDVAVFDYPGTPASGDLAMKATYAQQGGINKKGRNVPARPVLGLNETDSAALVTSLERELAQGLADIR